MNKYTFSTQSGKAYYCNSIPGFIKDTSHNIVGQLVHHLVGGGFTAGFRDVSAFENQIEELQKRLEACQMEGDIIFEYDIPRLGKRIDVVLLYRGVIFCIEFKVGEKNIQEAHIDQVLDYALDFLCLFSLHQELSYIHHDMYCIML